MTEQPPKTSKGAEAFKVPKTPEEFPQWVDWNTLNGIFSEIQTRAGVEQPKAVGPENIHFATPEEVKTHQTPTASAWVHPGGSTLYLNSEVIFKNGPTPEAMVVALRCMIHESLHLLSTAPRQEVERDKRYESSRSGLGDYYTKKGEDKKVVQAENASGNEALTETMAIEIFKEYLRRTGQSGLIEVRDPAAPEAYIDDRVGLHLLIGAIARRLEVSPTEVYAAFVREYFSQENSVKEYMNLAAEAMGQVQVLLKEKYEGLVIAMLEGQFGSFAFQVSKGGDNDPMVQFAKESADFGQYAAVLKEAEDTVASWSSVDALAGALKLH